MTEELIRFENFFLRPSEILISNLNKDTECEEYEGYNFLLDNKNVKYRKAKKTPKKIGQFVTLWKRNTAGQTEPFDVEDDFDYYIVALENDKSFGFFLFPKEVLGKHNILTNSQKKGKRGLRLYAEWDLPESKQADKTKSWQGEYFIKLGENENKRKFDLIFNSNF
ncbi:hypothetical protein SAMN06296427_104176 [Moheibacter sediminis]|uniref:MepB protein n=2 Tax=Moheibacter sediminis TaxID=1434700 RepID=A0A1W2AHU0_9FLAO|nr:hypothetical protein SAMN06296427_104176 [Moheibacter sediminis]